MVNEYEDIIQPPEQFRDAYKPIPSPRIGKWKNVKLKPVPRRSVKQMVKEYEDIIQPPEKFRDGYKPIPKPKTDMTDHFNCEVTKMHEDRQNPAQRWMCCLQCFKSESISAKHVDNCLIINGKQAINMPKKARTY